MKRAYLLAAVSLAVAYLALRLTGQVRYVSILSGTTPDGATSVESATVRAAVYVALHFAFVALVPALLLAAAFDHHIDRRLARRPRNKDAH